VEDVPGSPEGRSQFDRFVAGFSTQG